MNKPTPASNAYENRFSSQMPLITVHKDKDKMPGVFKLLYFLFLYLFPLFLFHMPFFFPCSVCFGGSNLVRQRTAFLVIRVGHPVNFIGWQMVHIVYIYQEQLVWLRGLLPHLPAGIIERQRLLWLTTNYR